MTVWRDAEGVGKGWDAWVLVARINYERSELKIRAVSPLVDGAMRNDFISDGVEGFIDDDKLMLKKAHEHYDKLPGCVSIGLSSAARYTPHEWKHLDTTKKGKSPR